MRLRCPSRQVLKLAVQVVVDRIVDAVHDILQPPLTTFLYQFALVTTQEACMDAHLFVHCLKHAFCGFLQGQAAHGATHARHQR